MRAWELRATGLDGIALADRPDPTPGAGELLVAMRAVALNPRDLQIALGYYPLARELPLVLCADGAGEVAATGEGVTRVAKGDRVVGIPAQKWLSGPRTPEKWASSLGADLDGVLREFVVCAEDGVVRVPKHLTDEEAACLPIAGVTAWNAVAAAHLLPGQTVLVQGTGGVSMFALQFAKVAGARVLVLSRSAKKLERALAAGADATIEADATRDWDAQVRDLTDGEGVDLVVEVTGQLERSLRCLRIGGTVSQIGYMANMRVEADVIPLLLSNVRLHGIVAGSRDDFEEMNRAVAFHELRPVVDRVFAFDQAADAFRYMAGGEYSGKIVVRL